MSKKTFKDNTANIDRFFSGTEQQPETEAQKAQDTKDIHYRINLKLRPEFKEYLKLASAQDRKSITEYVNDLIQADKNTKTIWNTWNTNDTF